MSTLPRLCNAHTIILLAFSPRLLDEENSFMNELAHSFTLEKVDSSTLDFQDIIEEDFSVSMFNEPPEMSFFILKLRQSDSAVSETQNQTPTSEWHETNLSLSLALEQVNLI